MTNKIVSIIIVAAAVAICLVALNAFGIPVPSWVIQIGWIVVIAVVAVLAIQFLVGFWNKPN